MRRANGHAKGAAEPATGGVANETKASLTEEQIRKVVAALEIPFDPKIMEWRVTRTSRDDGNPRGLVIPFADQRAYTDRLNALFTPAGWTRSYAVHTSANFERGSDHKTVAKVFVTCHLTIFGLGSHSATGEEWTDDENAGTSAEAQAFKRACSCFGLGRYLYYFTGVWVDIDERKRPMRRPALTGWATPEGWRNGLRPDQHQEPSGESGEDIPMESETATVRSDPGDKGYRRQRLIKDIEALAEVLGRSLYRGLLKSVAHSWSPQQVKDERLLEKTLTHMRGAERGLQRLQAALEQSGPESLDNAMRSLNLRSLREVNNLQILHKIVLNVEEQRKA